MTVTHSMKLMRNPLLLHFTSFELAVVALAILLVRIISTDGKSNWYEACNGWLPMLSPPLPSS